MRLHCDVRIEMVQGAICLFAAVPAALVHPFDLFISSAGSLVLLGTWNWDERVNLRKKVLLECYSTMYRRIPPVEISGLEIKMSLSLCSFLSCCPLYSLLSRVNARLRERERESRILATRRMKFHLVNSRGKVFRTGVFRGARRVASLWEDGFVDSSRIREKTGILT